MSWLALAATAILLFGAEALALRHPRGRARDAHAELRVQWLQAVSQVRGSELLAVQTIRNSLMSATMLASLAVLGLMGTVSLAAAELRDAEMVGMAAITPRQGATLLLAMLLFLALATSALAARSYHHAGFVAGMPVGSPERSRWQPSGARHLRQGGVLYGWSLRCLLGVAAPVAFIVHPLAGPAVALAVGVVLWGMDRAAVTSATSS